MSLDPFSSNAFQFSDLNLSSDITEAWRTLAHQLNPSTGDLSRLPANSKWMRRFSLIVYGAGPVGGGTGPATQGAIPMSSGGGAGNLGGGSDIPTRRTLALPPFRKPRNGDSAGAPTPPDSTLGDTPDKPDATLDDVNVTATPDATPAAPDSQQGIDLSDLRCVFHIDKSVSRNPNLLYVRIYNMAPKTMAKVIAMKRVQVSAGYKYAEYGVIFEGTVTQYVRGKENPTDTFLDIYAGDGDKALTAATTHTVFQKGSTQLDVLNKTRADQKAADDAVKEAELSPALTKNLLAARYRAHVANESTAQAQRALEVAYAFNTFSDNNTLHAVGKDDYRPGEAVVLTPKTGLVKIPEVTPQGIQIECLLNPKLKLAGLVKVETNLLSGVPYLPGSQVEVDSNGRIIPGHEAGGSIAQVARGPGQTKISAFTSPEGTYKIILMKLVGDTRGMPWYCQLICLAMKGGNVMVSPKSALERASPEVRASVGLGGPATQSGAPGAVPTLDPFHPPPT
jgi:hypothetical protein